MQMIFERALEDVSTSPELTGLAVSFASKYDMTPIDALHIGIGWSEELPIYMEFREDTKYAKHAKIQFFQTASLKAGHRDLFGTRPGMTKG